MKMTLHFNDLLKLSMILIATLFFSLSASAQGNSGGNGNGNGNRYKVIAFANTACTQQRLLMAGSKKANWTAYGNDRLDDRIGSLEVPEGWHVQIFENQLFNGDQEGWSYIITEAGCVDLSAFPVDGQPTDLSNAISSIKVLKTNDWVAEGYNPGP